ncbi:angiopoietin-4-like [Uranotaenia lowii]|uniref:angiopoietin-4-like n=1 Tax=Uranotaenia lowii TaxID=190385 RepID=UPI0024785FED|nr:angiopoietin-4-like [Uranotaenia lowii]
MVTSVLITAFLFWVNGSLIGISTVAAFGIGYEITAARLDSINSNIRKSNLQSEERFNSTKEWQTWQNITLAKLENESKLIREELAEMRSFIQKQSNSSRSAAKPNGTKTIFQTCSDNPSKISGVYMLHPFENFSFEAFCDQEYEGGGWIVIQNRFNGSVDFDRTWKDYQLGFGDLKTEFWIGLEKIHRLTSRKAHELHIIWHYFYEEKKIVYSHFVIDGANGKYRLANLGNYSPPGLGNLLANVLGEKFSTRDANNCVPNTSPRCQIERSGGWWISGTRSSRYGNLNQFYPEHEHFQRSRMMIRAVTRK